LAGEIGLSHKQPPPKTDNQLNTATGNAATGNCILTQTSDKPSRPLERERGTKTPGPRINSVQLLAGQKKLTIEHAGEDYLLRITKSGKLILTK
jgi:hemin uptake protein HemP